MSHCEWLELSVSTSGLPDKIQLQGIKEETLIWLFFKAFPISGQQLYCSVAASKDPPLERLTYSLPEPYQPPSDQLICLMVSPQRQQKAPNLSWATSHFGPTAGTSLASMLEAQNSLDILFLQIVTWLQSATNLRTWDSDVQGPLGSPTCVFHHFQAGIAPNNAMDCLLTFSWMELWKGVRVDRKNIMWCVTVFLSDKAIEPYDT